MALKSKFAQNNTKDLFRATKIFTDRVDARKVFSDSIDSWMAGKEKSKILVYYGLGGIGKSRLLKELYHTTDKYYKEYSRNINNVYISLDTFDCANVVNTLIRIRSQLKIDCALFDYAFLEYNAKSNITVEDLKNKMTGFESPVIDVLNECLDLGMGSVTIPSKILSKTVEFIQKKNFNRKYQAQIDEIKTLNDIEIYERLPYYLGTAISNAAQNGKYTTIFIDSYESIITSIRHMNAEEEWLKELFLSSENIRIVVASRDKLKWELEDEEWNQYMEQHLLSKLSLEDSRFFLKNVPIQEEAIVEEIVNSSNGMPLFLDMCVDMYTSDLNSDVDIKKEKFKFRGNTIINRYLKYLKDNEKCAVKLLSMLNCFDKEFAQSYLNSEKIFMLNAEVDELCNRSIFIEDEINRNLIKIDNSVKEYLRKEITSEQIKEFTEKIIECIQGMRKDTARAFMYFCQVIELEKEFNIDSVEITDKLIDFMQYFMDIGYWNEIYTVCNQVPKVLNNNFEKIKYFVNIFYMRRTGKLLEAQRYIKEYGMKHEFSRKSKISK